MRLLHTESSCGWGGQEIRILREAEGMRARGYEVFFAVAKGGGLVSKAREAGFCVYEVNFKKWALLATLPKLLFILCKHKIDLVNTHSSSDAWIGGLAARLMGKKILRTRHLSIPIRQGLNSRLLYKKLADFVVTTSSVIIEPICRLSGLSPSFCRCIPTGVNPERLLVKQEEIAAFRKKYGIEAGDCVIGTACFVRSWKGIKDLLEAAEKLRAVPQLKWLIVGGGYVEEYKQEAMRKKLLDAVIFTGHLESPYAAIASMDVFALVSTANEGISQALLQAAYLEKPLLATSVGGSPEVCLQNNTGFLVPPFSSDKIAEAALTFLQEPHLRKIMGQKAKELVLEKFTYQHMLDRMEEAYKLIFKGTL